MKKSILLAAIAGACACVQTIQASDWEFSLGLNYRSFDELEFADYALENPNNTGGTAVLDNGVTYTDNGAAIFLDVANVPNPVNFDPGNVNDFTLHQAAVTGQSDDIDEGVGFILGARNESPYGDSACYFWGLDYTLTTAYADTSSRVGAAVSNVNLTGFDQNNDGNWDANPYIGAKNLTAGSVGADVDAAVDYDLDLSLYTFGVGLGSSYRRGPLALRFSGGPTLTLTDFDLSRTETVTYNGGANTIYRSTREEDDTEFDLGAYLSAGVDYALTSNAGIGLAIRYDWIPDGPETSLADLELSGTSGLVQLLYKF